MAAMCGSRLRGRRRVAVWPGRSPRSSAHVRCSSSPISGVSGYDVDEVPWKPKLLTHPPVIENGEFVLPTGPGWGTDVNEDELRKHASEGMSVR